MAYITEEQFNAGATAVHDKAECKGFEVKDIQMNGRTVEIYLPEERDTPQMQELLTFIFWQAVDQTDY